MVGKSRGVPRDGFVTLRLPQELHEQIKQAAAGRSVSEEIRARLERSLLNDWTNNPKTQSLVEAIGSLTRNVRRYFGDWDQDRYAFDVFKVALDALLAEVRPKGLPIPPTVNEAEFCPGDTPETAGKALAAAEIMTRGL
jgi:hypothetical protein